jgi:propanol-preferring alcohol dehydrogenase
LSIYGGFAEYALVGSRQTTPLPAGMSAQEAAPLMCAGLTIYAGLRNCKLQQGQQLAIVGCGGGLGHLGIQFAENMGLKIVRIDTAQRALDFATQVAKKPKTANGTEVKAADFVLELGKEDGVQEQSQMEVDAAIILPETQAAFDYGMGLLKNWGKYVVVSFPQRRIYLLYAGCCF